MKRFLLRCLLFLVPLLALASIAYLAVRVSHRPPIFALNIDAVITGDSHVMRAIDESKLRNVRNLAVTSEPYMGSYYKLRELLPKNPHVTTVYLGCSYHNFSSYYDDFIFGKNVRTFTDRFIPVLGLRAFLGIFLRSPQKSLQSLVEAVFKVGKKLYIGTGRLDDIGVTGLDPDSVRRRIRAQYETKLGLREISAVQERYFIEIVRLCESLGRTLVLLNTPLSETYVNQIPGKYIDYFNALINEQGIEILDFSGVALSDDEFMPNGDHLNLKGAEKATVWFASVLESRRTGSNSTDRE